MFVVCPRHLVGFFLRSNGNAMSTFIQAFLLPAVIFVAWKLYQLVFARTALDNIRGPPSRSFLNGEGMSVLFVILLLISIF